MNYYRYLFGNTMYFCGILITIKRIYYEKNIYLNNYGLDADGNS